ncbi:MAG: FHA domain-containing protein [Burkholderiales bacterium]|nr:FHA domain-containing protein [Anaerolineae bacterium]
MNSNEPLSLAKITWKHPQTGAVQEYVLMEGATATIGRLASNEICIPEQHVSRQQAVISYRDGIFMITDLGSANGTFVNDRQVTEPYPLASGDEIRLYVPVLNFSAAVTDDDQKRAEEHGTLITSTSASGKGRLIITSGPQEGNTIPLLLKEVTVGRATSNANWEVSLQDPSVSRPHAKLELVDSAWVLYDMGSSNGTLVNGTPVNEKGRALRDGDIVTFGATLVLFRAG